MFGLHPGGHHFTNAFLHASATVLLFAFLFAATGATWPSVFVAMLFAVHPLHVESVAWIAERKDVLSALFWFLALWSYVRRHYWLTLLAFCLGLMSKPMVVTLPFVLFLLDEWPLRQPLRSAMRIKIPMLVLSAASATATFLVQKSGGAVREVGQFPLGLRVENAVVSYAAYIVDMFWPARLAVFYPLSAPFAGLANCTGNPVALRRIDLRAAGTAFASLSCGGMVVVPGNACAGYRSHPGRGASACGSVYVPPDGRPEHHVGVGPARST